MYASGSPVHAAQALPYLQMQTERPVATIIFYWCTLFFVCRNNKGQIVFLWKEETCE